MKKKKAKQKKRYRCLAVELGYLYSCYDHAESLRTKAQAVKFSEFFHII